MSDKAKPIINLKVVAKTGIAPSMPTPKAKDAEATRAALPPDAPTPIVLQSEEGTTKPGKPEKMPKVGETVTITLLSKRYDGYAESVLLPYLEKLSKHDEEGNKKKGPRRFKVLKDLPTKALYLSLKAKKYATTVGSLVEDAFGVIEEVAGEVEDWYGNLPEGFQGSDKGERLSEAANALSSINREDVPDALQDIEVVYYPDISGRTGRQSRVREAADMLRAAMDAIAGDDKAGEVDCEHCDGTGKVKGDGVEDFASTLESAADEAEQVEIPGMYD